MRKNIYLRPKDAELWAWASEYSKIQKISVSELLAELLKEKRNTVEYSRSTEIQ